MEIHVEFFKMTEPEKSAIKLLMHSAPEVQCFEEGRYDINGSLDRVVLILQSLAKICKLTDLHAKIRATRK